MYTLQRALAVALSILMLTAPVGATTVPAVAAGHGAADSTPVGVDDTVQPTPGTDDSNGNRGANGKQGKKGKKKEKKDKDKKEKKEKRGKKDKKETKGKEKDEGTGSNGNGKANGKAKGKDKNPGKGNDRGHGKGGPHRNGTHPSEGTPAACNRSVPASATAHATANRTPPGLAKKNGTPPGLAKKCGAAGANGTTAVVIDANASALELRVRAWRLLASANATDEEPPSLSAAEAASLRAVLNDSFRFFVGFDRVNSRRVFEDDKEVAAAAGKRAPAVRAYLIAADERLALTAIEDAARVRETLRARGVAFNASAVRQELAHARRAVAQAAHVRAASPNPVAASTHYRRAWTHAQRALDIMDAATTPTVTITRRADPARDGLINYTVQGTVFDVRPRLLGNVTVAVNGETRTTAPVFVRNATPGLRVGFTATVTLTEPANRIVVTATDSGQPIATDSVTFTPNVGRAVLRLDRDGLPDRYEGNATTTDPLDADSDATATPPDEAADGVPDGEADLDSDFLANGRERSLGTDPLLNDTDADGITDGFEVGLSETDPLDPDSDDDGVTDGAADPDGDGLSNAVEERLLSDPLRPDGDADGLTDPEERDLLTDPLHPDTDEDGLGDARELEAPFETDPLDPDTDDDGVLDGEESYTTTVTNESLGVTVAVSGPGDAAAGMSIAREDRTGFDTAAIASAAASEPVAIRSSAPFESAKLTITYDEDAVPGEESDLAAFVYDDSRQVFEPLDSTVHPANDTVTARTSRVGTVVVLSVPAWTAQFPAPAEVSNATIEQDSFDRSLPDCSGICESTGDAVVVGVTRDGPGELWISGYFRDTTRYSGYSDGDDGATETSTGLYGSDGQYTVNASDNTTVSYAIDRNGTARIRVGEDVRVYETTGRNGTLVFARRFIPASVSTALLSAVVSASADNGSASLVVAGASGSRTLFSVSGTDSASSVPVSTDLSGFAGETVTLRLEVTGDARILVESFAFAIVIDTDGDGVPDEADLCTTTAGAQSNGCPPSSLPLVTLQFPDRVSEFRITASGATQVDAPGSSVTFELLSGGRTEVLHRRTAADGVRRFSVNETFRDLPRNVTLRLRAAGTAAISLDSLEVRADTDGDGLFDAAERGTFVTDRFGEVDTEVTNPDTDGDGLLDGEEVANRTVVEVFGVRRVHYRLLSHPERVDTDGDGLDDDTEVTPWEVSVINRTGLNRSQNPYRWDRGDRLAPDEQPGTVTFTADPLEADSDGDGAIDPVERDVLHTDPKASRTYHLTREHQERIVDAFHEAFDAARGIDKSRITESAENLRILPEGSSGAALESVRLTDATDDFDFVLRDDGGFVFRALDRNPRTDVWVSNREERVLGTGVWDPDTDNDGVTDGQEAYWVTAADRNEPFQWVERAEVNQRGLFDFDVRLRTSPVDADTDGDGWWDGWLGVYGVGRTDNVVLYMEHLRSNGVSGHEVVPEQAGIHNASVAPVAVGANITGDEAKEHSNIHVGELQWGADPKTRSGVEGVAPSVTLEVDFFAGADHSAVNTMAFERGVEENYALYGVRVDVVRDEVLRAAEVRNPVQCAAGRFVAPALARRLSRLIPRQAGSFAGSRVCVEAGNGFSTVEIAVIGVNHASVPSDEYLFVAHRPEDDVFLDPDNTGINLFQNPSQAIFTESMERLNTFSAADVGRSPYDSGVAMEAAATQLHEIGHALNVGRADDDVRNGSVWNNFEVYSGAGEKTKDDTPESLRSEATDEWSMMALLDRDLAIQPMNGRYFAFSVEELSTIERP